MKRGNDNGAVKWGRVGISNPLAPEDVKVSTDTETPYLGDLRLTGPDAFNGFMKECINVVWVPNSEQADPVHIQGQWKEYEYIKGKWTEQEIPKERPKLSDEFIEAHIGYREENDKAGSYRFLTDTNANLPKGKDDYKSNYKVVHLCHHRGFTAIDSASRTGSVTAHEQQMRSRSASLDGMKTLPTRRLLDREHILDVFWALIGLVISCVAIFEPITIAQNDLKDEILEQQQRLHSDRVGGRVGDSSRESRTCLPLLHDRWRSGYLHRAHRDHILLLHLGEDDAVDLVVFVGAARVALGLRE